MGGQIPMLDAIDLLKPIGLMPYCKHRNGKTNKHKKYEHKLFGGKLFFYDQKYIRGKQPNKR